MSQETILPEPALKPLVGPNDYFARAWTRDLEPEPGFDLDGKRSPMLLLPAVALATLRYVAAPVAAMYPATRGQVTEASLRLAHWKWQGGARSAWMIAKRLESQYSPTGVDGFRRNGDPLVRIPRKGLAIIAATDALSCCSLEWYCDVPRDSDPYEHETVRLGIAIARFERSPSTRAKALTTGNQRRRAPID